MRRGGALVAVVTMIAALLGIVPAAAAQTAPTPAVVGADTVSAQHLIARTLSTVQQVRGVSAAEAAAETGELAAIGLMRVWRAFYWADLGL